MKGSEITDHSPARRLWIMDALCEAFERWRQDLDDAAYIARVRRILRDANRKPKRKNA